MIVSVPGVVVLDNSDRQGNYQESKPLIRHSKLAVSVEWEFAKLHTNVSIADAMLSYQ